MERAKAWANSAKHLVTEYGLEVLLFVIAIGNGNVLHYYLLETGSHDTWQLLVAVYAVELLVVWASLWRTIGLFISFCLFIVSLVSINYVFGDNALGHSNFSIAIFLGSLGNYVRRGHWRELSWLFRVLFDIRNTKTILTNAFNNIVDLTGLSVAEIRLRYNLTLAQANRAKQLFDSGVQLTPAMMKEE